MREIWLLLGVATELHLLLTYGISFKQPLIAGLWLLPLLTPLAERWWPSLPSGWPTRLMALLAFHAALFFCRRQALLPFDSKDALGAVLFLVALGGAYWTLRALPSRRPGPFELLWLIGWLAAGLLDPALPLLGLGVAALLLAFHRWPHGEVARGTSFLPWFVLGLVLLKPRWDHGLNLHASVAMVGFGTGWLGSRFGPWGTRLGARTALGLLGLLGVLYAPGVLWAWGFLAGLLWGWQEALRPPERVAKGSSPYAPATGGFLLGVLLSFALHANAWIPGLRHVIWLGN